MLKEDMTDLELQTLYSDAIKWREMVLGNPTDKGIDYVAKGL
jgi:hypothetical protein